MTGWGGPAYRVGTTFIARYTREKWFEALLLEKFKVQPPDYWIAQQIEKGRKVSAASAIWYRRYDIGRKYAIWDQAPDEDFRSRGYFW